MERTPDQSGGGGLTVLVAFTPFWTVLVNILAWLIFHLGVAYLGMRMAPGRFNPAGWMFRERRWERNGLVYETVFAIKAWKSMLPDGAALFSQGFRKKSLQDSQGDYLSRFVIETCRAEIVHWIVLGCSLLFFMWNSWLIGFFMVAYGILANLPCILAQRYNRLRLVRVVRLKQKLTGPSGQGA
jgi:glycosyl-4,4'-diaponeurosporenoate acyltransferase